VKKRSQLILPSVFLIGGFFGGCASNGAAPNAEALAELERDLENERSRSRSLEAELTRRREEIQRLESALALLRAEREMRGISIGGGERGLPSWDEPDTDEHGRKDSSWMKTPSESANGAENEPRITLRLYGDRNAPSEASAPLVSQVPLPPVESTTHASAARPARNAASDAPRASAASAAHDTPSVADADADYRRALVLIREGRLEEALRPLEAAIQSAKDVSRRFDAVYWRGEVNFLLNRFTEAEVDFASIVSLPREHSRLPGALLRLGQCMRVRGRDDAAFEYWKRLSEQFPTSSAARQVPQEAIR